MPASARLVVRLRRVGRRAAESDIDAVAGAENPAVRDDEARVFSHISQEGGEGRREPRAVPGNGRRIVGGADVVRGDQTAEARGGSIEDRKRVMRTPISHVSVGVLGVCEARARPGHNDGVIVAGGGIADVRVGLSGECGTPFDPERYRPVVLSDHGAAESAVIAASKEVVFPGAIHN